MSSKSVTKQVNAKPIIKISKQDEFDELEELSNMFEETSSKSSKLKNSTGNTDIENKPSDIKKTIKTLNNNNYKFGKGNRQLIEETSDLYDNLELNLELNLEKELSDKNDELMPKNFGNRWSTEDKKQLIELLKNNTNKEIDYADIALKLGRSEGGVKGEVKKMIITRYLNGEEAENIGLDMNVKYKFIKILLKSYIENEIDSDINNLEKENKLLKLKIENMELRKNIYQLVNK